MKIDPENIPAASKFVDWICNHIKNEHRNDVQQMRKAILKVKPFKPFSR